MEILKYNLSKLFYKLLLIIKKLKVNLKEALSNLKENEMADLIKSAVLRKKAKHAGIETLANLKNRPMILIGG